MLEAYKAYLIGKLSEKGTRARKSYYRDTPGNAEIERLLVKIDTFHRDKQKQSVLVTSAVEGEGKSTVCANIAMASSRNRQNTTLLIDFDLRRPTIHEIFGISRKGGVAEILNDQMTFSSCIKKTHVDNLKILTGGSLKVSPLEIFNSAKVKQILDEARSHFDYIFVDSAPLLAVSDPLAIAKVVDHVVFIVKAGATSRHVAKRAIDMLMNVDVSIAGIILNDMKNVLPSYYQYKYDGYHYSAENDSDDNGKLESVS